MHVVDTKAENAVVVELGGRMDAASAPEAEHKLMELIGRGETRLVLDLADLEYVSSAGLRVFLLVAKRLRAARGRLALAAARDAIREVFELAGFADLFTFVATREEAQAALG